MPTQFFECPVLEPGEYHAGQGVLSADRERFGRWVGQFKRMREAKIDVPLFWGHQMRRGFPQEGGQHPDDRATERARWQAGEVHDLKLNDQGIPVMVAPVPPGMVLNKETGALEDPVNHTSIKRVSVGIGDWKDGAGNWWEDAVLHVALTPLPVWANQTGFSTAAEPELLQALSADGRVRLRHTLGTTMPAIAKPKGKPPDEELDAPAGDTPEAEGEGDELPPAAAGDPAAAPNEMTDGAEVADAPADPAAAGPDDPNAMPEAGELPGEMEAMEPEESPLVEMAGKLGIEIPEGTTSENVEQVLCGVFAGLAAAGAKITVGSEHDLNPLKPMEGAQNEAPPMFALGDVEGMSPREKRMAEALGGQARADYGRRFDALIGKGLPASIVNDLREQATRCHLSLDDQGAVHLPAADAQIGLLEKLAEALAPTLQLTATLGDAKAPENPAVEGEKKGEAEAGKVGERAAADPEHQKWVQAEAEKTYGPGVKTHPVNTRS